ncbi:RagB/SusD family nutrient uptake outer membrane protein [Algoriphagus formosus]|uniref:RagB/SusD family nutrient uptake outer membrane protein n=1 Tax=Algoriphagus formosus TaxID=2007308 RepID=A0A4V6PM78_9BACT|nr:RagB/SusD family nutrient uptake outer membrane protein [Algoriphagus aquimaris]TDK48247.1 RagB/SusD family nutrient uptake outer membrane protein [Algoriphagus aquimaris]
MKNNIILNAALAFLILSSCEGFLDEKPDKSILVPESVAEFDALIDNFDAVNYSPVIPFIFSDDYYADPSGYQRFNPWQQNAYQWDIDPFLPTDIPLDYTLMYQTIFKANVLVDAVESNREWSSADKDRLLGKALFWRAKSYFELAVLHLPIPGLEQVEEAFELPLSLSPDLDEEYVWEDAETLFGQILNDLESSLPLLPELSELPTQPSRNSALALLARISLYLGKFEEAQSFAQQVINSGVELLDYRELDMSQTYPIPLFNQETILFTWMAPQGVISGPNVARVDSLLLDQFDSMDLRKDLFDFVNEQEAGFRGSYTGNFDIFTGIAFDEILLIHAEASERLGNSSAALGSLNRLLEKRVLDFQELKQGNVSNLLERILEERRKSLVFRGQRWADMKRLSFVDGRVFGAERLQDGKIVVFGGNLEDYQMRIPQRELDFK